MADNLTKLTTIKTTKTKTISSKLNVVAYVYTEVSREPDPTDDLDRGDMDGIVNFESIELVDDSSKFGDVEVPFKVKRGDIVHLVAVVYSSGDSFSRTGGHYELVDIFKDVALAEQCKIACESTSDFTPHITYKRQNGVEVSVYAPWRGYFEKFDGADVYSRVVI